MIIRPGTACLLLLSWAGVILAGCTKKEEPSPLGQAVIQQIERPINRAKQVEDVQSQAAANARKKIDEATQ
jgi:hypothetical protein